MKKGCTDKSVKVIYVVKYQIYVTIFTKAHFHHIITDQFEFKHLKSSISWNKL